MTKTEELLKLAGAADTIWYMREDLEELGLQDDAEYLVAANPATIKQLVELVRLQNTLLRETGLEWRRIREVCEAYERFEKGGG